MAHENLGKCVTLTAGADLSGSMYCFVTLNSSGQVILSSAGGDAIGVLQNNPTSGKAADVMVGPGLTKLKAGAAANAGGYITPDASGRGIGMGTGDRRLGQFIGIPTAANDIVTALFQKTGYVV
jgi:hypothetical protein